MGQEKIPEADPETQEEMIAAYVEDERSTHPTKEAILVKASGKVKTGMVELVKRGVFNSELARSRKIYIGIEEEQ